MFVFKIDCMEDLEGFKLSSSKPIEQFEYRLPDFKLQIMSAELFVPEGVNWQVLLPKVEIRVHVIADELLQYSGPIHLFNNPYNSKPFFELNKVIDNRVFDGATDLSAIKRVVVKLELIKLQTISEAFEFHFCI
jgi:hypothetical protein